MSSEPRQRALRVWAPVVLAAAAGSGFALARFTTPYFHSRYFPWIIGRGMGLAAYCSMWAMCLIGVWLRHPWRFRRPILHPETALRLHAALAGATLVLLAGHVVSLALDKYAGVGLIGVFIPGTETYRPVAVGVGVAAMWLMIAVAATARLGGRLVGRAWLPIHRISLPLFVAVFCHSVLAGTDTPTLRTAYAVTGATVVAMYLTARLGRRQALAPHPGAAEGEPTATANTVTVPEGGLSE
ncbi:MAG TPA: hypothetical protein VMD59_23115 [Acidimicrobiales bacterium]|nr:hypothetical protein [Acidimicrobiales bacterium]